MSAISFSNVKIEERPYYFDFTKNDFMGACQGMATLNHDPFPDKKPGDVVRTEIVCRQEVLTANFETTGGPDLRPGVALNLQGRKFAITSSTENVNTRTNQIRGTVEATRFLSPCEPLRTLAQLRESYAIR